MNVLHILGYWFVLSAVVTMAWVALIEFSYWRHGPAEPEKARASRALYPLDSRRVHASPAGKDAA